MQSIQLRSAVGSDGILRLQIPVNMPKQEMDIVVVIQPTDKKSETDEKGWPDNFFESVVGAWSGDLVRPPQGAFEVREDL